MILKQKLDLKNYINFIGAKMEYLLMIIIWYLTYE